MFLGFAHGDAEAVVKHSISKETKCTHAIKLRSDTHVLFPTSPGDSEHKWGHEFDSEHSQGGAGGGRTLAWLPHLAAAVEFWG